MSVLYFKGPCSKCLDFRFLPSSSEQGSSLCDSWSLMQVHTYLQPVPVHGSRFQNPSLETRDSQKQTKLGACSSGYGFFPNGSWILPQDIQFVCFLLPREEALEAELVRGVLVISD